MMRVLLSEKSRNELFEFLKNRYNIKTYKELSLKIKIPFKTLQNWKLGVHHLPDKIIPKEFNKLEFLDKKENNWAQIKGGKAGIDKKIANLKKIWHNPKFYKIRSKIGKIAVENLRRKYGRRLIEKAIETKYEKRRKQSFNLEKENYNFFTNERIKLDNSLILYSQMDKKRCIKFPKEMTSELAEEIGVHLGDGCLSFKKNYFSVKTNKKEVEYMSKFLFPLYKKLYNLDLKLMILKSVVGFEVCSKALFDFKNKILQIPYGEKVEKIEVPKVILESKNKEIYRSFIRGIFDTDGCIHMVKSKRNYPVITFFIKSEKLIKQVKDMLIKLGFIPYAGKWNINLNGSIMLNKWIKEIGSNNSKNISKLKQASSITWIVHNPAVNSR